MFSRFISLISTIYLLVLAASFASILSLSANAQESPQFSPFSSSSNTGDIFSSSGNEFLPVDEAYRLSLGYEGENWLVQWDIAEDYFLYKEQFFIELDQQTLTVDLPSGEISYDPNFEKEVEKIYHFADITLSDKKLQEIASGNETAILQITSQGCADAGLCYPPETKHYQLDLVQKTAFQVQFDQLPTKNITPDQNLLVILIFAFIGGVILNLLPCVFPVLSIKALSLLQNHDYQSRIYHGWSYTLGNIITFLIIAGLLLSIREAGEAVGWGFQLQSPLIISLLTFLFFVMGLSLSGLFIFQSRWFSAGQGLTQGKALSQSFFTGVLASIVASPCTAPLMAVALGYALTQTAPIALLVFAMLGLGMAAPFLLLSYVPKLGDYLPKPGAWMELFKKLLAFPLYLTAIWLLWVLGQQVGLSAIIITLSAGVFIALLLFLYQQLSRWKTLLLLSTLIIAVASSWQNHNLNRNAQESSHLWENYTEQNLQVLLQQEQPVFINLTADWCITCKINEAVVFTADNLQQLKDAGIVLLEGDWTNRNSEITRLLEKYNRAGVPLYLFYPNGEQSVVLLPQILTPGIVDQMIESI